MKTTLVLLALFSTYTFAADSKNQKVCDSLYDKAINNCEVSMCKDSLKDEGIAITYKKLLVKLNIMHAWDFNSSGVFIIRLPKTFFTK